jgi:ATP-dependent DNA helicase RecG
MVMTAEEFQSSFPGEGPYIEFKQGPSQERIRSAVVGFSNHDGGVLILGVTPSGRVSGLEAPGEAERKVHQAVSALHNPGRYEVFQLHVGDRALLVIAVARRREGFTQLPDGVVVVRTGASNRALVGESLSRFLHERAFGSFEAAPTRIAASDASPALVERLRAIYGWDVVSASRMAEAGMSTVHGAVARLTTLGCLVLLTSPSEMGTRAYIEFLRYPAEGDEPDRRIAITGPIDAQVEAATSTVLEELGTLSVMIGARRIDLPKLPAAVVREAIANAVAHRSYENTGTAVRVEVHPDTVVIRSPGTLPAPVTLDNMRFQQAARNPRTLEYLRRCGLAEDLGLGVDRMQDEMQAQLLEPPQFEANDASVTVSLHLRGTVAPVERAWVSQLITERRLETRDAIVVLDAVRRGHVTNSTVRDLLRVDSVEARGTLQRLRDAGLLSQEGQRGGAQYVPTQSLGRPLTGRLTRDEIERLVLSLASEGPVSNGDVRDATGLDRLEVLTVLRELVARGDLVQSGQKRGTRYSTVSPHLFP